MNKRLIGRLILLLVLIFIITACNNEFDDPTRFRSPSSISSYDPDAGYDDSEIGYYRINPETILTDLEQGKTDIFTPLHEDTDLNDELTGITIAWTQKEFLEIASALGKLAWDDPMAVEDWSVYSILFQGSCRGAPMGFDSADITYFKMIEVNGKKFYTTRLIEIDPYGNVVRWGSGATYPQPVRYWHGIDLTGARITADDALRIADENGGRETRLRVNNKCFFMISSSKYDNEHWGLQYFGVSDSLGYSIDLNTGKYEVVNTDQ